MGEALKVDLFPDWGKPEVREIDGESCVNAAGVLEVAKNVGTASSRKFLKAVLRIWRELDLRADLTLAQKQQLTLQRALQVSGYSVNVQEGK
jgi:hypothetical protein